jgi:vacuolar-type H+-ATPase subunit E/Vma4
MQITGGVRNELVEAAIDQVRGRMANLRTDACYPKVMRSLLLEALSELNGSEQDITPVQDNETICLEASLSDQALLESLMQSLDLDLPVRYSLKCWGGLVAKSKDGRIVVINTLEARLERAIPHLRHDLAALFESDQLDAGFNQPVENRSATQS